MAKLCEIRDIVPHALNGHKGPIPIMLTIEPRMGVTYCGWSPISFKHMFVMAIIFEATLEHMPLKTRYLIKTSNHIRHTYLRTCGGYYALKVAIVEDSNYPI